MSDNKKLTTNAGCPVADNQNVMTAGPRGPQLLQDVWFLEKLGRRTWSDAKASESDVPPRRTRAGRSTAGWCASAVRRWTARHPERLSSHTWSPRFAKRSFSILQQVENAAIHSDSC